MADLLGEAAWECAATPEGPWLPASVPGTAASALQAAGQWDPADGDGGRFDRSDWWWRCRFPSQGGGPWWLGAEGLATVCDVSLNGRPLLHSDSMWARHWVPLDPLPTHNELVLHFSALAPRLAERRPRPRWRTRLVAAQNLRWWRTSLMGRMPSTPHVPAPVGPWRPLRIVDSWTHALATAQVRASIDGTGVEGTVWVELDDGGSDDAALEVAGIVAPLTGGRGQVVVPDPRRWWPHTHGSPALYPVHVRRGNERWSLGSVGFRSIRLDRDDGAFSLSINDVDVFCRGACWVTPDPVGLASDPETLRAELTAVRDAGLNMLRITGTTVYESEAFWDLCDQLGILVWADAMFANMDLPDDEAFTATVQAETDDVFRRAARHPALAVISGGSEVEQQAAMMGSPPDVWVPRLLAETLPAVVAEAAPGVPYVTSSPTGGDFPFSPGVGVTHYFGVGAYLRPLEDARRAGVRFAAECLAFSIPPEAELVDRLGGPAAAGHDPAWKQTVPRDAAMPWDFEDVRDHYVELLYGVDVRQARWADPEWALDLGRGAVAEVMASVFGEWRRAQSSCAGGLVLAWRDLIPGAGWGLVDVEGRPKAPWYGLRRVLAPVAAWFVDEGLDGLRLHVANDTGHALAADMVVELYGLDGGALGTASTPVAIQARSVAEVAVDPLFGGFRDLGYAYRFGPPTYDVIRAVVRSEGAVVGEAVHLPLRRGRARVADVGLSAVASPTDPDGAWQLEIGTERVAQSVSIRATGFVPSDSWFHLAPAATRQVVLRPVPGQPPRSRPTGSVRALNSQAAARITLP